jgi:hypothetical protein
MIQAILLIALGFLAATLIGVLVAPSLWSRASRLTRKKLESTLPLTLSEIEAAQDQLRASFAVRLRRLETALASAKQKAANQLVENSRLQMQIAALKEEIGDLDMKLSERRNAATVLEQTITKRFPELDREIASVKAQLQERSYDLQDLTNKLGRRDEELAGAQRAAQTYQDEIERLRQALEKSAGDRGGRRVRRASQWDIEDYRAEYDRLNLEMSKLRQQLAHFQDRDAQQVGVIKGELQKLAELMLASAQPKTPPRAPGPRPDAFGKGPEGRKERPAPWRQGPAPMPLAARLKLSAEAEARIPAKGDDREARLEAKAAVPLASMLSILPEDAATASAPKNGQADAGPRSKMLQVAVPQEGAGTQGPASAARDAAAPGPAAAPARNGIDRGGVQEDAAGAASSENARPDIAPAQETAPGQDAARPAEAKQEGAPSPAAKSEAPDEIAQSPAGTLNGAGHRTAEPADALTEDLDLDAFRESPAGHKTLSVQPPTLLKRLASAAPDDASEPKESEARSGG